MAAASRQMHCSIQSTCTSTGKLPESVQQERLGKQRTVAEKSWPTVAIEDLAATNHNVRL